MAEQLTCLDPVGVSLRPACSLRDPSVQSVLERLHALAEKQSLGTTRVVFQLLWNRMRGYVNSSHEEAMLLKDLFLPLSADAGRFAYLVAKSMSARRIVEFGTSLGISTIY